MTKGGCLKCLDRWEFVSYAGWPKRHCVGVPKAQEVSGLKTDLHSKVATQGHLLRFPS